MSRKTKKSKAFPVVLIITVLVAALCAVCWLVKPYDEKIQKDNQKKAAKAVTQAEQEQKKN